MPLVKIQVNVALDSEAVSSLATSAHETIGRVLGKPSQYICVDVSQAPNLQFGGTKDPAAVSIGFGAKSRENREAIVTAITQALGQVAGVPPNRIFVALEDVKGEFWGWNGGLLG